jgi:hypothetical protein
VIGEGRIHAVTVCLAQGTVRIVVAYGVGVFRDGLLGFGIFAGTYNFGRLGFPRMHATVGGSHESAIATRSTFARHTLARGLLRGTLFEGGHFLAKLGDFGEEGLEIHGFD